MNRFKKAANFGHLVGKQAAYTLPLGIAGSLLGGGVAGSLIGGLGTAGYDWATGRKEDKLKRALRGAGIGALAGLAGGAAKGIASSFMGTDNYNTKINNDLDRAAIDLAKAKMLEARKNRSDTAVNGIPTQEGNIEFRDAISNFRNLRDPLGRIAHPGPGVEYDTDPIPKSEKAKTPVVPATNPVENKSFFDFYNNKPSIFEPNSWNLNSPLSINGRDLNSPLSINGRDLNSPLSIRSK